MALFRERHLAGRYLTLEELAAWIRSQGVAEGPPTAASLAVPVASYGDYPAGTREERRAWHLAWLRRETERVTADPDCELPPSRVGFPQTLSFFRPTRRLERLEIRGDGVLAWLKQIAETIVESEHPGWNEAEAVLFILTGRIPPVPLGRVAYATAVVPAASHITMEISPVFPRARSRLSTARCATASCWGATSPSRQASRSGGVRRAHQVFAPELA